MRNTQETDTRSRFVNNLADFIHRNQKILWTVLIAAVVFVAGYFVWTEWQRRTKETSSILVEDAQEQFRTWQNELDEAKKEDLEKSIQEALEFIIKKYPRQYAAQRAYFIRASMASEGKEWEKAAEDYLRLAESFPRGYLTVLSLFNAAVCYEQIDDPGEALALYRKIAEKYEESYLMSHVLFSIGRISEGKKDFENAYNAYSRLEDEYPFSNWTKAGRNRIIDLKIKGKIEE